MKATFFLPPPHLSPIPPFHPIKSEWQGLRTILWLPHNLLLPLRGLERAVPLVKETLGRCCPLLGDMQKKDPKEQEFPPLSVILTVDQIYSPVLWE